MDAIDVQLSEHDFDARAFVSALLPEKSEQTDLAAAIRDIRRRAHEVIVSIKEEVRSTSVLGNNSEAIIGGTRDSIVDLSHRIAEIHEKATETEEVVSKVCFRVKPLDSAKCNLTNSVASLRTLKAIMELLDGLHNHIDESQFQQSADCVTALSALFDTIKGYHQLPQVEPLLGRFSDEKRLLRNKVKVELEQKLSRGSGDETNLPLCAVIDAFGDDVRTATIDQFCGNLIGPYDGAFEFSPLKEITKRFRWFKQRIEFYNSKYHTAFPVSWKIQYYLSLEFCDRTAAHLSAVMTKEKPTVAAYMSSFESVVKFEQKMAETFATEEMVYIGEDEPMPFFDNTPAGVRAKVDWRLQKENGTGKAVKIPAKAFIGRIAVAFAPHMSLYLDSEQSTISDIITSAAKNLANDIDDQTKQMKSATTLVLAMKAVIEKTARFNVPGSLLELFMNLKSLIAKYAKMLTKGLPQKPKQDRDYELLCAICNTSALLLDVVDSLATRLKEVAHDQDLVSGIVVDDTKETVSDELRKHLMYTVDLMVKEIEPILVSIATDSWRNEDSIDEKVPDRLVEVMQRRFSVLRAVMSHENMNAMRLPYARKIVATISDGVLKQKRVVTELAKSVLMAVKEVKVLVMAGTEATSSLAKRRIDAEFSRLDIALTVISIPDESIEGMGATYVALMGEKKSSEDFLSLVKLRGDSSSGEWRPLDEAKMLMQYNEAVESDAAVSPR